MAVRLKDVAAHAGVSVKTVSNVVNDHPNVSQGTRDKVLASAATLGYRPNLAARQLRHGRGGFIALAVPQLDSPYFSELAARFSSAAARRGYLLLLDVTHADHEQERLVLAGMRAHMIDGLILSPLTVTAEEVANRTDTTPLVMLGEKTMPPDFDHVSVDSVAASRAMGEHLLSLGRSRFAAIGREQAEGTASLRLQGYRSALEEAGVTLPVEATVGVPAFTREHGYQAMRSLLALPAEHRPEAVFAFSDLLAIGALRACHDAGVRVPEDIAIAGFDDIAEGRYHSPGLTSIAPDLDALVAAVLDILTARIAGEQREAGLVWVPWSLRVRESTRGAAPDAPQEPPQ